jgi:hypothetical protein
MTLQSKKQPNPTTGSSMLDLAPEVIRKKVHKRRQKKEAEMQKKMQQEKSILAEKGEFAPPLTP